MRPEGQGSLTTVDRQHIVIAGAGIGGLTAALALAQKNFSVSILEKNARLEPAGAGIQLSPNASRILVALGLGDALEKAAVTPDAISVMTARTGDEAARIPLGPAIATRYGAPYWIIHRADLQSALLARVARTPDLGLKLGAAFVDASDAADHISVEYDSSGVRSTQQADLLIGSDGIHSAVRKKFHPDHASTFSGKIAWRSLINTTATLDSGIMLWLAPDAHIVAYPVGSNRINVVAITAGHTDNAPRSTLPDAFDTTRLPSQLRDIIAQANNWTAWPMHSVDAPLWRDGRVALLGDAAHAMMPFAAQGAAMAIEDAAVLANALSQMPQDLPAALQSYASLREPRLSRVRKTAAQTGAIYHMQGPMAFARDMAMRILGGQRLLDRQRWIYDWKP